jgi:NAD(P)-dependent dehydrogenase (short-subunit alcohol dehydrogenase family)
VTDQTRIAIVTGSARCIEATIAKRLSNDGFTVAVLDLEETACKAVVDQVKTCGGEALAVRVDVADGHAVEIIVGRVTEELGAPNALVNNGRYHRRQHAVYDDRRRLGCCHERSPARLVPDEQGHPEVHEPSHVGQIVNLPACPRSATAARRTTPPRRPASKDSPRPWRSNSASSGSR